MKTSIIRRRAVASRIAAKKKRQNGQRTMGLGTFGFWPVSWGHKGRLFDASLISQLLLAETMETDEFKPTAGQTNHNEKFLFHLGPL